MTPSGSVIMGVDGLTDLDRVRDELAIHLALLRVDRRMTLSMYSVMTFTFSYSSISSEASGPFTSSRRMDSIRSYSSLT